MKSNLKLYKVEFKPELNPLVENLESYLADCDKTTYSDFQYIKHNLNIVVKIPMSQEFVDEFPFNYAAIKNSDSDDTFYYYIMDINWVAQNTIALTLGMDTVNTLGQTGSLGNPANFTDETHIYRQHGDRFYDTGQRDQAGGKLLRRRIDREAEGFSVAKEQVSSAIASDKNFRDNQNWALMYKTASEPDAAGPLGIYLVPTFECQAQSAQTEGSVGKFPEDFSAGSWYYFLPTENPNGRVVINYDNWIDDIGNALNIDWFGQVGVAAVELTDDTYFQFAHTNDGLNMSVYKRESSNFWNLEATYKNLRLISFTKGTQLRYGYNTQATKSPAVIADNTPYTIPLQTNTTFTRIKTLQEIDHYDSRIAKIIKLPYCPLDVAFRNNEITLPFGWELEGDLIKWSEAGLPTLYRPTAASFALNLVDYWYPSIKQSKEAGRESKLYHSEFMDWNVVYDSFVKSIALERFDLSETDPGRITVDYQQTNTLGNNMLFKINFNTLAPYTTVENFEEYLLVDRNNEDPIFTSNYLDYLRSGYAYDVAANKIAEKRARAEAVQSTGAAIAQLATASGVSYTPNKTAVAPAGSPMGAWVGWEADGRAINPRAVGSGRVFAHDTSLTLPGSGGWSVKGTEGLVNQVAYSSLANAANSWTNYSNLLKSQKLQMNAKLTDLQMQSIGVSGSGTIDLLESYCGNKINVMRYEPRLTIKRRLYDFFDYFGYSHDYYEVPNISSRYWYNYIQCSPILVEEGLGKYKEVWLEDLKARYEIGVTVFHDRNGEWNFKRRWENWETWVITE